MRWDKYKHFPSDDQLHRIDNEVASREAEIRRPGRQITIISEEALQKQAKWANLQSYWENKHAEEIRRRNTVIRHTTLQFLEDNFPPSTERDIHEKVLVVLAKSITTDFLMSLHLNNVEPGKPDTDPLFTANNNTVEAMQKFALSELTGDYTLNDLWLSLVARKNEETPSCIIKKQLQRDLAQISEMLLLLRPLPENWIMGDERFREMLQERIYSVDNDVADGILRKWEYSNKDKWTEKYYLQTFDDALDFRYNYDERFSVNELKYIRETFKTLNKIQAFYLIDTFKRTYGDQLEEGLTKQKEILTSLLADDRATRLLIETILSSYLRYNRLVEVTAKFRNESYQFNSLDKEGELDNQYDVTKEVNLKYFPEVSEKLKEVRSYDGTPAWTWEHRASLDICS